MIGHIVTSVDEFDRLQPEWRSLHDDTGYSIFQSFEWLRTWWTFFGERDPKQHLHLITLRENDHLVGLAPLFIEEISIPLLGSYNRLSFLGRGQSDYLDILVTHGMIEDCTNSIAALLAKTDVQIDFLYLEDIPERSKTRIPLIEALIAQGLSVKEFVSDHCPRANLASTWAETVQKMATPHRKEIKYLRRNLNRHFEVSCEWASEPQSIESHIDMFIELHQERWHGKGSSGAFLRDRFVAFHKEIARLFCERGWLMLAFLTLNGERVAANYGFRFNGEFATYLNGMADRPEIARYSPGKALHSFCIEQAICEGALVYDFMRGREQYKYDFDAIDVPNWTCSAYRSRSLLTVSKVRADLMTRALRRWMDREGILLRWTIGSHGYFSRQTIFQLSRIIHSAFRDGIKKIARPDLPLDS